MGRPQGSAAVEERRSGRAVYAAEFDRIDDAFAWEKRLQGWGRAKREALIRGELTALSKLGSRRGGKPRTDRREPSSG